jgi:MFS transporter, Spinster family, sphingosine-1-phosphate transporter
VSTDRRYLLGLLLLIFAFNAVDRLALGLVLQDIKTDLQLTDTQLGFLTGIAFALFYAVMGIPIARWADRGNRITIISITTALWSAAVMLCGLASSFIHLLLVRVAAGVGEAGCIPAAQSLLADYYNRVERPRAVSIYMLGVPLSAAIGFFFAGWLNELYGWRTTFLILSVPGLVLAALAWFTLKEPRREAFSGTARHRALERSPNVQPSLKEVLATLWGNLTFRHLVFFNAVVCFFGYGVVQWQPAFFIRTYGFQTGELGTWLAMIYGLGGLIGTYLGGEWAARRAAHNEALQLKAATLAYCVLGLMWAGMYIASNASLALGLLTAATVGGATAIGPLYATIQTLLPDRMRAMGFAILNLLGNLIGMGLGPLAAGALSDALMPWFKEDSLRFALLLLSPGYLWAAWHLWRASHTVIRDIEATAGTAATRYSLLGASSEALHSQEYGR